MPWFEVLLSFLVAAFVARRVEKAGAIQGLLIGILAGLMSVTVSLAFGGRVGLHNSMFFLISVGLGWLGGFVGQKL